MSKSMRQRWLLTVFVVPGVVDAGTLRVPADYATIQAALDRSSVGDTVLVAPGSYSDWTFFNLSAIVAIVPDGVTLVSEAGPEQTIIDLAPLQGAGAYSGAFVHFQHTSGLTVIDGFKVTGFPPQSVGVSGSYSRQITVRNCVFEVTAPPEDPSVDRVGISEVLSDVRVSNCTFIHCSGVTGGGIAHTGGRLVVESSTFIECQNRGIRASPATGPGPHSLEVRDCLFQRCVSSAGGGSIAAGNMWDGMLIEGCVFEEPQVIDAVGAALSVGGGA